MPFMTDEPVVTDNPVWNAVMQRGGELTRLSIAPGDTGSWDFVATRGIIATALYAIAHRDGVSAPQIGLDVLAGPLFQRTDFLELVTEQLAAAGHAFDRLDAADPVSEAWAWLNRYWPTREDMPPGQRAWDGLGRGIARGLRWPAIDVCLRWAASAVDRALSTERGALPRRTPVLVTEGEFSGARGFIESAAWRIDPTTKIVEPGPPVGYLINLGEQHGFRTERLLLTQFEPTEGGSPR